MNVDTRVVTDTFPSDFGPEGIGGGSFYDWIPDGEAWQFQGYDENGFPRSLDGRLMDAYEVLNSSASASASGPASRVAGIACAGRQDFFVKHNGGYMTHGKIGQAMKVHLEKLLDEHGKNELIPVVSRMTLRRPRSILRKPVNSRAERIACKPNHNSESRYSTHL